MLKAGGVLAVAAAFALRSRAVAESGDPAGTMQRSSASGPASRQTQPMQIGILLNTFTRPTLEARLDAAKAGGIDCVQMSTDCAGLAAMPDQIAPELVVRMREAAAARGITLASMQGTFNMTHPDAAQRQAGLRQLRVLAEACGPLGINKMHICTGTRDRQSMWRRHPDNTTPEAWRDMVACVRQAVEIAKRTNVVMAFEPEVSNVVDSAQKARRLLDEVASEQLKVTIDPANIFHTGELPRMREMLDEAFQLLGKDIVLAHAKDLDHDGDAGHLAAGKGRLDYDRYLSLLHTSGYRGPLLLHGLTEAQVPGCVAFLREKVAQVASVPSKPNAGLT